MGKKFSAGRITNLVLGNFWVLVLLVAGALAVFNVDLNNILWIVLYVSSGLWLIGQGGWKSITSVRKKASFASILHSFAFAFGLLFIYVGLINLPALSAFSVPTIANLTGWITLLGAAVGGVELWV